MKRNETEKETGTFAIDLECGTIFGSTTRQSARVVINAATAAAEVKVQFL